MVELPILVSRTDIALINVKGGCNPVYHKIIHFRSGPTAGMVKTIEYIQKCTGKVLLNTSTSQSWDEFASKFPEHAKLIKEATK